MATTALTPAATTYRTGRDLSRSQTEAAPPVIVVTNFGPGGTPFGLDLRALEMDEQMGQKKRFQNQDIPPGPFPGQKIPPCDTKYGEEEINGGCWVGPIASVKPPCGPLFRKGDGCYRPLMAAPPAPQSTVPTAPAQGAQ